MPSASMSRRFGQKAFLYILGNLSVLAATSSWGIIFQFCRFLKISCYSFSVTLAFSPHTNCETFVRTVDIQMQMHYKCKGTWNIFKPIISDLVYNHNVQKAIPFFIRMYLCVRIKKWRNFVFIIALAPFFAVLLPSVYFLRETNGISMNLL